MMKATARQDHSSWWWLCKGLRPPHRSILVAQNLLDAPLFLWSPRSTLSGLPPVASGFAMTKATATSRSQQYRHQPKSPRAVVVKLTLVEHDGALLAVGQINDYRLQCRHGSDLTTQLREAKLSGTGDGSVRIESRTAGFFNKFVVRRRAVLQTKR